MKRWDYNEMLPTGPNFECEGGFLGRWPGLLGKKTSHKILVKRAISLVGKIPWNEIIYAYNGEASHWYKENTSFLIWTHIHQCENTWRLVFRNRFRNWGRDGRVQHLQEEKHPLFRIAKWDDGLLKISSYLNCYGQVFLSPNGRVEFPPFSPCLFEVLEFQLITKVVRVW